MLSNRTSLFFLFFLFLGSTFHAQVSTNSLLKIAENENESDSVRFHALEKYYSLNQRVQPDSALMALEYYYGLAKEKNALHAVYGVLISQGIIYRDRGELEKSKKLYQEAAVIADEMNNPVLKAIVTGNLGNVFLDQSKFLEATRSYYDALNIFKEQEEMSYAAMMLSGLGKINEQIGNYELALSYYQKSYEIIQNIGANITASTINQMYIGSIHFKQEEYLEAKSSFNQALELLLQKDDKVLRARCYALLAKIHLKLNQLDIANDFALKNLTLTKEFKNENGILNAQIILAQLIFEYNIDSAAIKAEAIEANLQKSASLESKNELYELLYKCYKYQNKLNLSLKMLELHTAYQDSIQIKKNSYAVARETVKTDYELRLYESKLESETEKAALELRQLKRTFGIISISVVLIAGLLFYFISNNKKNRERRDLLLEEIKSLKLNASNELVVDSNKFELSREKIEFKLNRSLNETDWKVLTILFEDPVITNKEIAEKAFMSVDGIGSSLRRMYEYFEIKESKYKKISLLLEAIKTSNDPTISV